MLENSQKTTKTIKWIQQSFKIQDQYTENDLYFYTWEMDCTKMKLETKFYLNSIKIHKIKFY